MKKIILAFILASLSSLGFAYDLSTSRIVSTLQELESCRDNNCRVWNASFVISEQEHTISQYLRALSESRNVETLQMVTAVSQSVRNAAIDHREKVHQLRSLPANSNTEIYRAQQEYMTALMETLKALVETYRNSK